MASPIFWIRELVGASGKVLRVGGSTVQEALKDGTLQNKDLFYTVGTTAEDILDHLFRKGLRLP